MLVNNNIPPAAPLLNIIGSSSVSCIIPLPDSIGSVSNLISINIEQEEGTHYPKLFVPRISDVFQYTDTFVTVNPIGFAFSKNISHVMVVYKALRISTSVSETCSQTFIRQDRFYALKVLDDDDPESILMFKEETRKSRALRNKPTAHQNLLGTRFSFIDNETNKRCVVVDPHIPGGSIRAIMKNRFPQGFPEDLILTVLRSILKGLKFLHKHRFMHKDINAGHIYLCDNKSRLRNNNRYLIKLGFASSVYEDVNEMENTPYLPVTSMSKWAAAPEVYNNEHQPYTKKADIWLVGITALELAYGGLNVSNRNALEAMIKSTSLPTPAQKANAAKMFKSYVKNLLLPSSKSNVNVDDKELGLPLSSSNQEHYCCPFSQPFADMVTQCLAWDPKKRPSVGRLLSHPFFKKRLGFRKDGQYFYDMVF